jgi:hypothetical protein
MSDNKEEELSRDPAVVKEELDKLATSYPAIVILKNDGGLEAEHYKVWQNFHALSFWYQYLTKEKYVMPKTDEEQA